MEWYIYFIAAYMFTGLALFEWAWAQVKSIRDVDETRDSQYPAFRRLDAPKWRKWRFYIGALTMLPIRMVLGFGAAFLLCCCVRVLTIGMEINENKPLTGCRPKIIKCLYRCFTTFILLVAGVIPQYKNIDYDYS